MKMSEVPRRFVMLADIANHPDKPKRVGGGRGADGKYNTKDRELYWKTARQMEVGETFKMYNIKHSGMASKMSVIIKGKRFSERVEDHHRLVTRIK
jgi:hypothetical protein